MWFADVICDFDWLLNSKGDLGTPRIKLETRVDEPPIEINFLLYGGEYAVRHLRIIFHTNDQAIADDCLNRHILLWTHALEVSSTIASGQPCSVALFPGTTHFAVITGEGDESAKAGYRLIEWHFMKGKDGLAGNHAWRTLLEKYRDKLNDHLRPNQTLYNLFEETRAFAAHAVLDKRSDVERMAKPGELITWTFSTLEAIVSEIMNDPALGYGRLKLHPRAVTPMAPS